MSFKSFAGLMFCCVIAAGVQSTSAEDTFRNYGAVDLTTTPAPVVSPGPAVVAGTSTVITGDPAAPAVAFGHRHRDCCGYGAGGFPAAYSAYSTYQPAYYARYASGYGASYWGNYTHMTPNPYGYYQNGWVWGSSGPTYRGPFPVWNSPSGIYDYRYNGWGSYGWGGWGGTGPAGWGYQGGFYW